MVAELTGSSSFTYITAVTKVVGSRAAWQDNATFRENLGGNRSVRLTQTCLNRSEADFLLHRGRFRYV